MNHYNSLLLDMFLQINNYSHLENPFIHCPWYPQLQDIKQGVLLWIDLQFEWIMLTLETSEIGQALYCMLRYKMCPNELAPYLDMALLESISDLARDIELPYLKVGLLLRQSSISAHLHLFLCKLASQYINVLDFKNLT